MYDKLEKTVREEYELEKTLKVSQKGHVLLLRHKATRERVVCRRFAGSSEVYEKMLGLACPHLPKILSAAGKNGQVLVLEEYIPGDSLSFLLEESSLPPEQAQTIAIQVCRALQALHSLGAVHRDIKPGNILLRGDEAVVIDFDASRLRKEENISDTRIMGTTGYAAPEQFGFSQTDARADIYSVGVLLNEMLTRRHPATQLVEGRLRPVIERCIEVNIAKRYPSAEALIAALEDSAAPRQRGKRWLWILPAAALLCTALLLLRPGSGSAPVSYGSSGEPSTPSPIPDSLLLDVSVDTWTGSAEPSYAEFEYDLDGDGETETYYFIVGSNLGGPSGLALSGVDSRVLLPGLPSELIVAPAVAKDTESGLQYAYEFSELLKNHTLTLYCSQQWGTDEPEQMSVAPLNGLWPGATLIQLEAEDAGVWVYVLTAELDGETLTARGVSHIFASATDF